MGISTSLDANGIILSCPAPPRLGRMFEPRLGNDIAHPRTEMLEPDFLVAARSHGEALRSHALLNARDHFGVLALDLPVVAQVKLAPSLHFGALLGQHLPAFADQARARTGRQPRHNVHLAGGALE